jgi:aminoglycoside phosphotransferase (APT) family kinase protein
LIDSGAGYVTGIIDWSDAAWSDPRGDFVGLWMWCGDDFVENVLKEYQCPIDNRMRQRIRYWGLSMTIGELYYAQAQGYDSYARFCHDCLRREFCSR